MRSPEDAITRWRLIDAVEQAPQGSLVLIVAPAGYGKSTLLRQWTERTARASATVAAHAEFDAGELMHAIAEALVAVVPGAEDLVALARRAEVDWACDLLPALLALAAAHPFALAIDDTHVLTSPSSREALSEMARSWPAPSILLLAGRERPGVPLVRDRLDAPIVSFTDHDLDFDDAEMRALAGESAEGSTHAELLELTGGWPAGLRLAALVRDEDLGGDPISVERYLTTHVLSSFTPNELDYLGHVAALAPARAALIDLVLRRNDTWVMLRTLQQRGLPMLVVPEAPDGEVVVHALLANVLVKRLERRRPGAIDELVDLAVDAAERAGELTYGFTLLDRHGRRDRMRWFVYVYTFPLVSHGRTRELRGWLDRFSSQELEADPHLVFAHANVQRPRDEGKVRAMFAPHERDLETQLPDGNTPALACQRMLTAFGLQPADPADDGLLGGWRQTSGVTRAWDLYADDRLDQAAETLLSLRDSAAKYPLTDAVGLAKLAIIALETGRPNEAEAWAAQAAAIVAEGHMEETTLGFIVDTVSIKLARRRGDLDAAEQLATAARRKMAKVGDGTLLERVTTLTEIASLYLDLEYPVQMARSLTEEAAGILDRWERTSRLDRQLAQLVARLDEASVAAQPAQGAPHELITTAELRVLRYLPSHLTLARIAQELYVSHSTVKSQCQSIYRKLDVGTRADAVTAATRLGLLA